MKRKAMIGTRAPGFSIPAIDGTTLERKTIALEDYLDRWLLLMFYPRDFSLL
jgi:peroxiredoxin